MPAGKGNIRHQDGNEFSATNQPKNRRKPIDPLTQLLKKILRGKKEVTIQGIDTNTRETTTIIVMMPNNTMIVQALLRQAAKGNVMAIKEVFDRVEGKVMQRVEADLTGNLSLSDLDIIFE